MLVAEEIVEIQVDEAKNKPECEVSTLVVVK